MDMLKKIAKKVMKAKDKVVAGALTLAAAANVMVVSAYAAPTASTDIGTLTTGIDNIKSLSLTVITAIGWIALAWTLFNFFKAFMERDDTEKINRIPHIIGGVGMICVSAVMNWFAA